MRYLFLSFCILLMVTSTAFSEEEATDNTSTTLENAEVADPQNTETIANDQTNTTIPNEQSHKINKWDFSDHPKDKENKIKKAAGIKQSTKRYDRNIYTKPKDEWVNKKTETTKASQRSGTATERNTYSK